MIVRESVQFLRQTMSCDCIRRIKYKYKEREKECVRERKRRGGRHEI